MESIALLWPDRLVSNLGWTLIHFSWQGTFIALLYALGERWLCRESANRRYAAGCLALAVMVLAPAFTMGHLAASPREATHSVASMVTPPASAPAQTVRTGGPESSGRLIHSSDPNTLIHEISWRVRLGGSLNRLLPWLVRGWAAGVVILSVDLLTGWFKVRRIRGESIPVPHEMWGLKFTALVKTLAVRRPVRLLQSVWIEVPTVIGHFKPVILVPASALTRMSPDQLELLLAHELAHIRRHDYLINTLQTLIEIVLFYHPAVWWVSRRVREEREHCCDDLAVSIGGSRLDYIRALATMEEQRGLSSAWTLGARGGGLVEWIRRLVRPEEPAPSQTGWSLAGLLLLILGVSLTGSCGHSTAPPDESAIAAVRDYLSHPKEHHPLSLNKKSCRFSDSELPGGSRFSMLAGRLIVLLRKMFFVES